jgi:hypothetical protein
MAFDLEAARKAGWKDEEIAAHLAKKLSFDMSAAKSAGYSAGEIVAHLLKKDVVTNAPIPSQPTAAQAASGARPLVAPPSMAPQATGPLSIGDRVVGGLEAAGTVVTGSTTGVLSAVAGGFQEVAKQLLTGNFGSPAAAQAIENAVTTGAERGTFIPRTPAGTEAIQAVGEVMQNVPPITGVTGTLANATSMAGPAVTQAAAAAAPVVRKAGEVSGRAAATLGAAATGVVERVRGGPGAPGSREGQTGGSVGAQALTAWQTRKALADELGVPLLKGQVTRTMEDQSELHRLAADPTNGAPIRERMADQRQRMVTIFDEFVDDTGAMTRDAPAAAEVIDSNLRRLAASAKQRIRTLYQAADKAGETEKGVTLGDIAGYLTEHKPEAASGVRILNFAREKGIALGIFKQGDDGVLVAQPTTLKNAELFRRTINRMVDDNDKTDIRFATVLKDIYDQSTEGLGGDLYKKAREARREFANDFENRELTKQLLGTKRGTADRAIAIEDVVRKMVMSPSTSLEQLKQTGALLKRDAQGQQAWRELQGSVVLQLQSKAIDDRVRDSRGTPYFNAKAFHQELKALDQSGKLDYIFGKRNAERMRTLDEVAQVVFNPVPGTVNTSGTAYTLAAMMDMMNFTAFGVPVPVATIARFARDNIKDRKLRARVQEQFNTNFTGKPETSKEPQK